MKKLLLVAAVAITSLFATVTPAEAGCCCKKKEVCTTEVCREYHCETKCCFCKTKQINYVTITYCTTYVDCCGNYTTSEWTETNKLSVCKY